MSEYWSVLALLAYMVLEWWLGKTKLVRAASLLELLGIVLDWILRRKPMAITSQSVPVAQATDKVMILFVDIARLLKKHESAPEIAKEEIGNLIQAFSGIQEVAAEWAADPVAVGKTVGSRTGELIVSLVKP